MTAIIREMGLSLSARIEIALRTLKNLLFIAVYPSKHTLGIQLGKALFIHGIAESVQHHDHQAKADEHQPQQAVVTLHNHQGKADAILNHSEAHRGNDAGHAADAAPVGGRDPARGIGIVAQYGHHLPQGEHEHAHKQKPLVLAHHEQHHAREEQPHAQNGFWYLRQPFQRHGQ